MTPRTKADRALSAQNRRRRGGNFTCLFRVLRAIPLGLVLIFAGVNAFAASPTIDVLKKSCEKNEATGKYEIIVEFTASDEDGDLHTYRITIDGYEPPAEPFSQDSTETVAPTFPAERCKCYDLVIIVTDKQGNVTTVDPPVCCPCPEDIPTLTEWGLIIFGVVLLGFITWVFLKRRKVIGVRI